jgi:aldose sugar dehydrogenase
VKRLLAAALLVAAVTPPAHAQDIQVETIVSGLDFPTAIAFAEDGTMYVNERRGRIRVVEDRLVESDALAEIPTIDAAEMGLLGSDISPDGRHLYVFATAPDGTSNQIWRVPLDGGKPRVVLGDLPSSAYHNGGGVVFDETGALLVSNGETHDTSRSQDPGAPGGKVYRLDEDGRAALDNPFEGPAFAIGLRNPFAMTIDPVSGAAFVSENGPEAFDEINRVDAGSNLGWPDISGPANGASPSGPGEYRDPIAAYEEIVVPTGIAFADPATARRFAGDLFFGTYGEMTIHRLSLNENRTQAVEDEVVYRSDESIIAMEWGPEGLYFSTPTQIKLLAIGGGRAGGAGDQPSPSPTASESPSPSVSPSLPPRELSPAGTVVFLVVAAILAFGVIYTLRRGRALRRTDR